jgi:hypothetical protein
VVTPAEVGSRSINGELSMPDLRFFVIVCEGRTGSNLLVDLLDSHPQIECAPELYHPQAGTFKNYPGISHREFLDLHTYKTSLPIRGFKMPINWILEHPDILAEFRADNYKIIRLTRENVFDHFLSVKLAILNSNWCSESVYDIQSLKVDPWELLGFMGTRHGVTWATDLICGGMESFSTAYEQLLQPESQASLLKFLGAETHELKTVKIRMRTKLVHEIVENYDELVEFFSDSPYAGLFPAR